MIDPVIAAMAGPGMPHAEVDKITQVMTVLFVMLTGDADAANRIHDFAMEVLGERLPKLTDVGEA